MAKKLPHPVSYAAGPFVGMNDSPNPKLADPELCTDLLNVAPDFVAGTGLVGRPGFVLMSTTAMASGADGQGVIQHITKAGVRYTFLIDGGKVYRVTWTTGTLAATLTDVTPVGVTINASAKHIYGVTFADTIVVSDGVNRPWKMTSLSSTPVVGAYLTGVPGALYGPPVVYYAKLFGIKADERDTIIWSEEADPDTGYEAGGFNNAWTLGQTDQSPLTCLAATNEALYYFRARSTGRILGAVETDFVNAGVHDSVSTTDGTISPAAVILIERDLFFLDDQGLPMVVRAGGTLEDLSPAIMETVSNAATDDVPNLSDAFSVYVHELDLLLMAHPSVGSGAVRSMIVLHLPSSQWFGVWRLAGGATDICAGGLVVDYDGQQRPLLIDTAGLVYTLSFRRDIVITDFLKVGGVSTAVVVEHSVQGPWMGYSDTVNQLFDRIDVTGRALHADGDPDGTTYTIAWATPTQTGSSQNVTAPGGVLNRDTAWAVGINAHGRGLRPLITHATSRGFAVSHIRASGTALSDAPGQG